jgi:hypothetical protein
LTNTYDESRSQQQQQQHPIFPLYMPAYLHFLTFYQFLIEFMKLDWKGVGLEMSTTLQKRTSTSSRENNSQAECTTK